MNLTFLEASVPLTKSYQMKDGELLKTPYPFVWEFTSINEEITSLARLEKALKEHAAAGRCLLKGVPKRPLVQESRAGSTDTSSPTEFVVLDLDGLDAKSIDAFLYDLGLADISYIVQWSASYGITDKLLRAHVFMLLDKPTAAPLLKQWLIHLNHTVPSLRDALRLTKTGNALLWPLDVSACQNDKLIYIAPPLLKGIRSPVKPEERIKLVRRKHERLSISGTFNTEKNRELTNAKLHELREREGMPKRTFKTRMHGSTEVLVKPDQCTITEMKQERGFVYFNLNGGDSWAYYHPENNPDYIFNFKGEPTYLTRELLPDYWAELTAQATRTSSDGIMYLAFCDKKTASYWIGTYDQKADVLDIHMARTATQVREFAKQVGLPMGDFIPYWDLVFDPHDNVRVDPANKVVNTFYPSEYMKATAKKVTTPPKTIMRVITHVLGGEQQIIDHFINWLAYILQMRDRTRTSWVLHGRTGTGKGILCNHILRPLFGPQHTTVRRMEELDQPYNHFMQRSLLVFVDEVQTSALSNERGVMAKLRSFITEEYIPMRAMYSNAVEMRNFTNWIFNSNMPDPVHIPRNDRRTNVAKYQTEPIQITDQDLARIKTELQSFHDYLLHFPLDKDKAGQILETDDRNTMIEVGESSADTVSNALLSGNFEFFVNQLPQSTAYESDFKRLSRLNDYRQVLKALMQRSDPLTSFACSISREELRVMYDFAVGSIPDTPNKFTSFLKHHRIHIKKVWLDNKTISGIKVQWKDGKSFPAYVPLVEPPQAQKVVPITQATKARKKA